MNATNPNSTCKKKGGGEGGVHRQENKPGITNERFCLGHPKESYIPSTVESVGLDLLFSTVKCS